MTAAEYLASLKALLIAEPTVRRIIIVREEAQEAIGLFRARLELQNGDLLEMFERFEADDTGVTVRKYSYHWQDSGGGLRVRWDNAPHHPELPTFPSHLHRSTDDQVEPHGPITLREVLDHISAVGG